MASFLRDDDELVSCPYNPCHKMKKCRLQVHITKCQQAVLRNEEEKKKVCPFNAQHHVSEPEFHHHLQTCPNRDYVDRQIARYSEQNKIDIPQSSTIELSAENWDNEVVPYPVPGYDPKKSQKKLIFQDTTGMLPSERKRLYDSLHSLNGEEPSEPEKENRIEREWALKELRQPKMKPEVMKFRSTDVQYSSLGLGRGQPSGNRRIAANIFGVSSPKDDSAEHNCLGRGMGRGFPN